MEGPQYIFALQNKSYAFWQESNGGVTINHQPYFLKYSPIGWDGYSIQNVRNKNYWGVDRTVSIPFSYVQDGAHILKYIMYTKGIEESVYLSISKLQLDYNTTPTGNVSISNLTEGTNVGTISGLPNQTVYVKVIVTGVTAVDNISGALSDTIFVGQFAGTQIYKIDLPASGVANFNVFFDNSSTTATASFVISTANGDTKAGYGYWYKQIYRGEVDLSEFLHDGTKITCTTLEDGLAKYLKANENTVYELNLDVPDAVMVKMDGINLHQKANYAVTSGLNNTDSFYALDFPFTDAEGDQYGVESLAQIGETIPSTTGGEPNSQIYYVKNSGNYFFKNDNTHDIVITIAGTLKPTSSKNDTSPKSGSTLKIKTSYPNGSGGTLEYPLLSLTPVVGQVYNYPINLTITVHPNEKLFMIGSTVSVNSNLYDFEYLDGSKLSLSFITRRPPTYIPALRPQYIFEQLINLVTEGNYTADYTPYFQQYKDIVWTSGNAIRGIANPTIKIALSTDFFQFYNCFDAVGLSENMNVVLFNSRQNLIDRTNIIPLGEVGNFKVAVAKDYLFNQVNIGYQPISTDVGSLNGLEEFNVGYIFSGGTTKAPAVIDKVSKTSGSCYEQEKIRTTIVDQNTTDYSSDNKNYLLSIEGQQQTDLQPNYYNLDRSLNSTIPDSAGMLEPATIYNLKLRPAMMLQRNLPYLSSSMFLANLILKYISSDNVSKLICDGLVEKADVQLGTGKFFYPLLFTFDVPAPTDLEGLLDVNPLSVFSFTVNGIEYVGILNSISTGSIAAESQTYELLSVETNDLTTLINFYG